MTPTPEELKSLAEWLEQFPATSATSNLGLVDAAHHLRAYAEQIGQGAYYGCLYAGPGRGDCAHFIGLPGKSIPGQHDGPDDTVDYYGKPNGWCWSCWKDHKLAQRDERIKELKVVLTTLLKTMEQWRSNWNVEQKFTYTDINSAITLAKQAIKGEK